MTGQENREKDPAPIPYELRGGGRLGTLSSTRHRLLLVRNRSPSEVVGKTRRNGDRCGVAEKPYDT